MTASAHSSANADSMDASSSAARAGFRFIFIKGMLWLAAPFVFYFAL